MTLRDAYLPSGGQKSWVDDETPLPMGILERFYVYIHNFSTPLPQERIRLQIWRPTNLAFNFVLVWERKITVDLNSPQGLLYEVSVYFHHMYGMSSIYYRVVHFVD